MQNATEDFRAPVLRLQMGREIGRGAYGSVEEVEIPGAVCAAKKIHDELVQFGSPEEGRHVIDAFVRECKLMSTLRHPHIVQFIGVCHLGGSMLPSLIMELLDTSLHDLLESTPKLALSTKQSVLLDVAKGLFYLHSQNPPILHRDLTARNVLLNSSLVAKITDMGVARIMNLRPGQLATTMTRGPGNIVYMPPEAMGPHCHYDSSLDIFSFGNLALFTLTQQFPNLLAATYTDEHFPELKIIARSEIERRSNEFRIADSVFGSENQLLVLTRNCLENRPTSRPSACELVKQISDAISSSLPSRLDLEREIARERQNNKTLQDEVNVLRTLTEDRISILEELIKSKQRQLDEKLKELQGKDKELLDLREFLEAQKQQLKNVEERLNYLSLQVIVPLDEFRKLQIDVDKMKPTGHDVELPVSFIWKKQNNLPNTTCLKYPVVLDGKVYMQNMTDVYEYNPRTDLWTKLPDPGMYMCGMMALNGKLTLITDERIAIWKSETQQWMDRPSSIPTGRAYPGIACYKHYVIVAGGILGERALTSSIEILDTLNEQWYKAPPMPHEGFEIKPIIVGDHLYLHIRFRGVFNLSKSVLKVSLHTLVSHAIAGKNCDSSVWEKLPEVPYFSSCLFSVGNLLLTAGGSPNGVAGAVLSLAKLKHYKSVTDIHLFNPLTNQWIKIGDLPEAKCCFGCIVMSPGKLLVAGGESDPNTQVSTVHTAEINRFQF